MRRQPEYGLNVLLMKVANESDRQAFVDCTQHEQESGKGDVNVGVLVGTARAVPLGFTQQVSAEDYRGIAGVGSRSTTPGRRREPPPDFRGPGHYEFQRLRVPRTGRPPGHPQKPLQRRVGHRPRLKGPDHAPMAQHVLELHRKLLSLSALFSIRDDLLGAAAR